ncbi:hypothetical protein Tco_0610581, partial [Tanacetum coccineum]
TDHLIKDCNFHDKKSQEPKLKNVVNTGQREGKPVWDNTKRINHQNFSKYPHLSKTFVPSGVLTRTGLHRPSVSTARPVCTARPSVSTARPVCTARPSVCTARPSVSTARPVYATRPIYPRMDNVRPRGSCSPIKRSYYTKPAFRPKDLKQDVKTFRVQNMTTVGTRAVVNTGKGKLDTDLKKSRWVWRPKGNYLDHVSKDSGSFMLKKGNLEIFLQDHALVDSGCSSHMTGNKAYLSDYEDFNGGFVAFGKFPVMDVGSGCTRIKPLKLLLQTRIDPTSAFRNMDGKIPKGFFNTNKLEEPKTISQFLKDDSWVKAMQEEGFSSNSERFVVLVYLSIWKKDFEAIRRSVCSSILQALLIPAYPTSYKERTATTPIESNKPLVKDEDGCRCRCLMSTGAAVDQGEGSAQPAEPHHTPVDPIPSTSQPPIHSLPYSPPHSPPHLSHQSPPFYHLITHHLGPMKHLSLKSCNRQRQLMERQFEHWLKGGSGEYNSGICEDLLVSISKESMINEREVIDFVTPTNASGGSEQDNQSTSLEAAQNIMKGCFSVVFERGQKEGKAPMVEEDIQATHKTKEQIRQEEAGLEEAIKLQAQMDEEVAKQIHLDEMIAKRVAEEEALSEQQKKRKA